MVACAAAAAAAADDDDDEQPFSGCSAADPRHMLSYVHRDNFEGLAVAAEVIALGKKKKIE